MHRHVCAVELLLCDLNGVLRGKWAPADALEKIFKNGVTFPLSLFGLDVWGREVAQTGLHIESGDRDGLCRPIPGTLSPTNWPDSTAAQLLLSMEHEDGAPFMGDPRQILKRQVTLLEKEGLTACSAFELEFFLLKDKRAFAGQAPVTAEGEQGPERQDMYALSALEEKEAFFEAVAQAGRAQNLAVDTMVSEAAPGQFEINLNHHSDALRTADEAALLRRLVKTCAKSCGLKASFMAKPFMEHPGNGMHVHVSLLDKKGQNIFAGEAGVKRLHQAIAGVLETMEAFTLVFVNTLNGFRRLRPGSYAPTRTVWGKNNRSVSVRVPVASDSARRLEHRVSGADANPYLVMCAVLAGMRKGLKQKKAPPPAADNNAYEGEDSSLPSDAWAALALFEKSAFAKETFTPLGHHLILELKRAEFQAFMNEITSLEYSTYG